MGFFIEIIISVLFLIDRVISIIEKRKELKQKHLSPRKQLEQFAKTNEVLDRALDKILLKNRQDQIQKTIQEHEKNGWLVTKHEDKIIFEKAGYHPTFIYLSDLAKSQIPKTDKEG